MHRWLAPFRSPRVLPEVGKEVGKGTDPDSVSAAGTNGPVPFSPLSPQRWIAARLKKLVKKNEGTADYADFKTAVTNPFARFWALVVKLDIRDEQNKLSMAVQDSWDKGSLSRGDHRSCDLVKFPEWRS